MGADGLFNMIATLGFPIVLCLILLWYIIRLDNLHKDEVDELTRTYQAQVQELIDKHHSECQQLSNALNNNTTVMKQILEHMRKG